MIRKAFIMGIFPGRHDEYERRHRPIWPELQAVLHDHGVQNYSIFLDAPRNLLFGYAEIESEERWQAIARTDACRRWWAHLVDVMPTHPDHSPVSQPLPEVFHLE